MIDCNKTALDILLRKELEQYAAQYPDKFKLWFTIEHTPEGEEWKYAVGFINEQMMREHFYGVEGGRTGTFLCGPPGLIKYGAMPGLKSMGFKDGETVFGF